MKVTHRRLYVQNTKNRLERKYERFSHIQNHEIRDNIHKSKKGERQRTEAILKYCQKTHFTSLIKTVPASCDLQILSL